MPTFVELSQQLAVLNERKAILLHLLEYIDDNFLPNAGSEPKKKLLGANNLAVPVSTFEDLAANMLTAEVEQIDQQIAVIEGTPLGASSGGAVPEPPPPPPEPPPVTQQSSRRRHTHTPKR